MTQNGGIEKENKRMEGGGGGVTVGGKREESGWGDGSRSAARRQRGQESSRRMSWAIFSREQAMVLSATEASTMASCAASASNLFSAVTKGSWVSLATSAAKASAKPSMAWRPVPTAVPP